MYVSLSIYTYIYKYIYTGLHAYVHKHIHATWKFLLLAHSTNYTHLLNRNVSHYFPQTAPKLGHRLEQTLLLFQGSRALFRWR